MSKYKKYLTGCLDCSGSYSLGLTFQTKWGRILFKNHKCEYPTYTHIGNKRIPVRHLIIESKSMGKAREVLNLIIDCLNIYHGFSFIFYEDSFNLIELTKGCKIFPHYITTNEIYLASIMAARASFRESYVYAIHKLVSSLDTLSVQPLDLDPASQKLETASLTKPLSPKIRVIIANAIVNAYSAIEELNFQILPKDIIKTKERAKIFVTKDKKGILLPETIKDITSRLKNERINLNENFNWSIRGKKKIIEKKKAFYSKIKKSEWSSGPYIRDEEIYLINAIDRASFLRSQVASHKLSDPEKRKLIKVLSIYDVSNVQLLARRLILESLKLWRIERF